MDTLTLHPVFSLAALAGAALLAARAWGRRPFVEVQPRYRSFFRHLGLLEADDFLALPAVIVSGHPDRNVGRVTLGSGPDAVTAFLKREHRVPWPARLESFLAGAGLVSRSLREARALQALQREGIGCAEWLAAGEDGRGRAFLLVREVAGAVELRAYLRDQAGPGRRRVARALGAALARLHAAGFEHFDLYSKHILVHPAAGTVHVLDWQRSQRRRVLGWEARCRDLASLHATLAEGLASPRERLACLRAYRNETLARRGTAAVRGPQPLPLATLLARIEAHTRRRLLRRHVREKRELPVPPASQDWVCLDGEALCATPALLGEWPRPAVEALALDRQPRPGAAGLTRRWLPRAGGGRALLVRRDSRPLWATLWSWLRREPVTSPERRQAGLLFRLQRHAVAAPRVLAMGQRRGRRGRLESFLLTEPAPDAVRLDAWVARELRAGRSPARRWRVLRQAGALLQRLHAIGCYLGAGGAGEALGVRPAPDGEALVVDSAEAIRLRRRPDPRRARRDLMTAWRALAAAGCGRTDLCRFVRSYQSAAAPAPTSVAASRPAAPRPEGDAVMTGPPAVVAPEPSAGSLWQRLWRGARRVRQRPDWPRHAGPDWADRVMDTPVTDRFHAKQGRSTGRWVLPGPGGGPGLTVYLKRHYQLPWWLGWLAWLWPDRDWSPAMREWAHLEWARGQGVPVPEVVAAAEFVGPWGRLQSVLAVAELTDMLPLNEAIPLAAGRMAPAAFRRWKRTLIAEMARLTRMLHDRRCFHKDLYLCHFYVPRADVEAAPASWRGRVHLIDLHRLAHHRWTWRVWQLKDLAQLLYSSEIPGVDARDQLAFWADYRGTGPRRGSDRWLRRWVVFKWQRYRRHNLRRKARGA